MTLRPERVERLLGERIARREVAEILERLGFGIGEAVDGLESLSERLAEAGDTLLERLSDTGLAPAEQLRGHPLRQALDRFAGERGEAPLEVTVPYFRDGDVEREADLIEEVARIHGLDRLPTTLPARRRAVGSLTPRQRLRRSLEDALRSRGLSEAITYSFTSPATLARLGLEHAVRVANPLSEDQSVMRPLILPGLLDAARHNAARGNPVALFESAHVYRRFGGRDRVEHAQTEDGPRGATPVAEPHHIAALLTEATSATWRSKARPADFFAAKGLVEMLLAVADVDAGVEPSSDPFLHPARQASVVAGSQTLGFVGELHPSLAEAWDLGQVSYLELDADAIAGLVPATSLYMPVSSYPPVIQDIAVVVPDPVPFADVETAVRGAAGDLLENVALFDLYRGDQIDSGEKSLALRLEFRAPDRTLTDADVARIREQIASAISSLGGRLRA